MAKEKTDAAQAQPPINLTVVQEAPKPAAAIPGFDETLEGGYFVVPTDRSGRSYKTVDAFGEPVDPEKYQAYLDAKAGKSK